MRPKTIFRTTSFRLVATYLGIFTLSVVVLGIVVYFNVGRQFEIEFDERVATEMDALVRFARTNDAGALTDRVRSLTLQPGALDYRLEDQGGRFLAGNLPPIRNKEARRRNGWIEIVKAETAPDADEDSDQDWERALVKTLDNGEVLIIGQELTGVNQARHAVLVSFVWGLAATLLLGLGGGLIVSANILRRLEGMSRAAQGIMAGDLRQRIPEVNSADDLGRVAHTFNLMFDRIERLIESNRHVSHNIAHDLRRPLARIVRRLEATRAADTNPVDYRHAVDAAIGDVYDVLDTFNALLRIAQIETGARRAGFKNVDLAEIAREVAEAFQPAADDEGKHLEIQTSIPIFIPGDDELLKQMIANLLENALRHTPGGTQIKVRTCLVGDARALVVCDNGTGVPDVERPRIFERFYRLDTARTTPGDGLGLSLVAAVAELHSLDVAAEDNRPGLCIVISVSPR